MENLKTYDVIVVGAGHAGCEAASAAATMGSKVLLVTIDMVKIAHMSCNPAIGGIAKGQIVKEIDALGGYSGIVTDRSMIQFRMLNKSKGPAMWSPRAQCDRMMFSAEWRKILEENRNIDFWQDNVHEIIIENNKAVGVRTSLEVVFKAKKVILTNGTFLNGLMHIGKNKIEGGRMAEPSSYGISKQLENLGFKTGRMKTGTPARLDGRSIDFSLMDEQEGDERVIPFSFMHDEGYAKNHRSCYITFTDGEVHDELRKGFDDSPLYNGTIKSIGPRYCPSIETKLVTFEEKDKHQLFVEPEGIDTVEYYLNGFSSSLPWDVQLKALRKIKGLENVQIFRPGYAIEYDYFDPTQLYHTMETKMIEGLYFAGQINGTTGYEEAGAQGIIAGINAHHKINGKDDFILQRDQAYIGVLIDDLVTKGVDEPYRMFTSRAEYRILLRQDDADARLTPIAYEIGLAGKNRYERLKNKIEKVDRIVDFCSTYSVKPKTLEEYLLKVNTSPMKQGMKLKDVITRPQVRLIDLISIIHPLSKIYNDLDERKLEIIDAAETLIKYKGYIDRERLLADKTQRLEGIVIENKFNYLEMLSLSTEGRQKLDKIKPRTIGQASRISGVSPADINVLLIKLGR